MTDKKTEALKLALEALKELKAVMPIFPKDGDCLIGYKDRYNAGQYQASKAIAAAKQALEQPVQQQEPVAWGYNGKLHEFDPSDWATGPVTPLYTSPPAKTWVGLTDDEVSNLIDNEIGFNSCCGWEEDYTRAIEAKLKEKNT